MRTVVTWPRLASERWLCFEVHPCSSCLALVLCVVAPPDACLVAPLGGAVKPLVHAPQAVKSARIPAAGPSRQRLGGTNRQRGGGDRSQSPLRNRITRGQESV